MNSNNICTSDEALKSEIKQYFEELLKEEIYKEGMSDDALLILITRKGYSLFKTVMRLMPELKKQIEDNWKYMSDRYIIKLAKPGETIRDKRVYIFDDTIVNGNNMFYYYCMFDKTDATKSITPIVFASSTEFLAKKIHEIEINDDTCRNLPKWEEYKRIYKGDACNDGFQKTLKKFYNNIQYKKVLPPNEIAALSKQEMIWSQENLDPMVMDLPVFRYEKDEKEIVFTKDEFDRICVTTPRWQFVKNSYNGLEQEICCDFFQLNDELLYRRFQNLFFNFIVKCKHQECDEGVKIIFIPFAMVKSGSIEDTWKCFTGLLQHTEYYDVIKDYITKKLEGKEWIDDNIFEILRGNHNICRGIFRAVIFSLSNYIGYLFQEKLTEEIGRTIFFDTEYLKNHSENAFAETFIKEYNSFNKNEYVKKILSIESYPSLSISPFCVSSLQKEKVTEATVELYVREQLLKAKYETRYRRRKIVTIEDLEKELDRKYFFESDTQKRLYLTKALILLLELSCSGNDIVVDDDDSMIYRGFRAGENSEVLMPDGLRWIYPYYYALYFYQDEHFFIKNHENFKQWIRDEFYHREYVDNLISKENLEFYLRYFEGMKRDNLYERIMNKAYVLTDYSNGNVSDVQKAFIDRAFYSVKEWGDEIEASGSD